MFVSRSILLRSIFPIFLLSFSVKLFPSIYYIDFSAKQSGSGSINDPFNSFSDIPDNNPYKDGLQIYVRKGVYNANNNSLGYIDIDGVETNYIDIKPFPGEKVIFTIDYGVAVKITGSFINFSGFEIIGNAQDISYEDAIGYWWKESDKRDLVSSSGIAIKGHHITVDNCIVHDMNANGINANGSLDYITISNNIIYNCVWWMMGGGSATGLVSIDRTDSNEEDTVIIFKNNLVFGCEQRIYSRVFSKGVSHLIIDEGKGVLVQPNKGTYNGYYLIDSNIMMFNGKAINGKGDRVIIQNNIVLNNGATLEGVGSSIRLISYGEDNSHSLVKGNLIRAPKGYDAISDDGSWNGVLINNDTQYIEDERYLNHPTLKKAKELGIEIKPTNFSVNHSVMTNDILRLAKEQAGAIAVNDLGVENGIRLWEVIFPNRENVTNSTTFLLKEVIREK